MKRNHLVFISIIVLIMVVAVVAGTLLSSHPTHTTETSFSGYLTATQVDDAVGGTWSLDTSGSYNYTVSAGTVTVYNSSGKFTESVGNALGSYPFSYLIPQGRDVLKYSMSATSFMAGVVNGYHLKFVNGKDKIELDLVNLTSSLSKELEASAEENGVIHVDTSKGELYYGFVIKSYHVIVGLVSTYMVNIYSNPGVSQTDLEKLLMDVAGNLGASVTSGANFTTTVKTTTVKTSSVKSIPLPFNLNLSGTGIAKVLGGEWTLDGACSLNASVHQGNVTYVFFNGTSLSSTVSDFSQESPMNYLKGNVKDAMHVTISNQYYYGNVTYMQIVTYESNGTQFQVYVMNISPSLASMLPSEGVHASKYDTIIAFKYDGFLVNLYVGEMTTQQEQSEIIALLKSSLEVVSGV